MQRDNQHQVARQDWGGWMGPGAECHSRQRQRHPFAGHRMRCLSHNLVAESRPPAFGKQHYGRRALSPLFQQLMQKQGGFGERRVEECSRPPRPPLRKSVPEECRRPLRLERAQVTQRTEAVLQSGLQPNWSSPLVTPMHRQTGFGSPRNPSILP